MLVGFLLYFYPSQTLIAGLLGFTWLTSLLASRFELTIWGVETATFATVVTGYLFGPETGLIAAFAYISVQLFTGRTPGVYIIWVLPGYLVAGWISGIISSLSIFELGLAISLALQSSFTVISFLVESQNSGKYVFYASLNVIFNSLIFSLLGPLVAIL